MGDDTVYRRRPTGAVGPFSPTTPPGAPSELTRTVDTRRRPFALVVMCRYMTYIYIYIARDRKRYVTIMNTVTTRTELHYNTRTLRTEISSDRENSSNGGRPNEKTAGPRRQEKSAFPEIVVETTDMDGRWTACVIPRNNNNKFAFRLMRVSEIFYMHKLQLQRKGLDNCFRISLIIRSYKLKDTKQATNESTTYSECVFVNPVFITTNRKSKCLVTIECPYIRRDSK